MRSKRPVPPDESPFNSPAEMLARLVFVISHGALGASLPLLLLGFISGEWRVVLGAVGALAAAWLGRLWLRRRDGSAQLDAPFRAGPRVDPARPAPEVMRLVGLLREWDALERERGSPEFDPWALQAVRNEIHALVQSDAALAQLFERHRHAA